MTAHTTRRATHAATGKTGARPNAAVPPREFVNALSQVAARHGLPSAALARLAADAARIELARGTPLFEHGTPGCGLYLVISGRLMVYVGNTASERKVLRLAETGDAIGLAAALLGHATLAGATALADSTLLLIPRDALLNRALHDAPLTLALATMMARRALELAVDLEAVSLQSGRERIVTYLQRGASAVAGGAAVVLLTAKKSLVASRLSVTPEYFSRTLRELISCGAIDVNGRQIIIRDAGKLRGAGRATD
jgi:CRP-like cAMP-binding protein